MSIRTNAYYELLDAMKEKGCPLCFLLRETKDLKRNDRGRGE